MDDQIESTFAELRFSSRVSLAMILAAVVLLIGTVIYSATRLGPLERQLNEKKTDIERLQLEIDRETKEKDKLSDELTKVRKQLESAKESVDRLQKQITDLRTAQNDLFDFFSKVTEKGQVRLIDPAVDWNATKNELMNLPSGRRKQTLLSAILLAWKEIPFSMGQQALNRGFDSPRFIQYVLKLNGVDIPTRRNERLSDTLMNSFRRMDTPSPGDLVFYKGVSKGDVGSYGLIYLAKGGNEGSGVGIGTLETKAPLQIISLRNLNPDPLIGYFRVKYPDEKSD
jgi:cell wall-associated NlpC family hydrolase